VGGVIAGLCGLALAAALFQPDARVRSLDKGDQSFVDERRTVIARSTAEWRAAWNQHAPDRSRPPVDFGREMVVGVFLGSRPTAGFAVEIVGVKGEADALIVRYRETRPAAGAILAQVVTMPYHLAAVPAHKGEIRFVEEK
jgi:hypothetical protein